MTSTVSTYPWLMAEQPERLPVRVRIHLPGWQPHEFESASTLVRFEVGDVVDLALLGGFARGVKVIVRRVEWKKHQLDAYCDFYVGS